MAETTTSGTDFQLHEALKNVASTSTNGNTYSITIGDKTWDFQDPGGEDFHFGNHLSSLVKAIYQMGLRSSGNPTELDPSKEEEDVLRVTPDEETLALAGNCSPSIIPGTSFLEIKDNPPPVAPYTPEFPPAPGSGGGSAISSTEKAPPPVSVKGG